jgi:hypothetical protein
MRSGREENHIPVVFVKCWAHSWSSRNVNHFRPYAFVCASCDHLWYRHWSSFGYNDDPYHVSSQFGKARKLRILSRKTSHEMGSTTYGIRQRGGKLLKQEAFLVRAKDRKLTRLRVSELSHWFCTVSVLICVIFMVSVYVSCIVRCLCVQSCLKGPLLMWCGAALRCLRSTNGFWRNVHNKM